MAVRPSVVVAICAISVTMAACAPPPGPLQPDPTPASRAPDPTPPPTAPVQGECGTGTGGPATPAASIDGSGVTDTVDSGLGVVVAATEATNDSDTGLVSITSVDANGTPSVATVPADSAVTSALAVDASSGADVVAVSPTERVAIAAASDPLRQKQWAFDDASYEAAWECGTGDGVTVAVLDTGVDTTHPEFAGRITAGPQFVGSALADPTGGRDDHHGHGTHVAGTVAAGADNGLGVAGVAPDASLLAVQVLDDHGEGWSSGIAAGITWSVDHGATVLNLSLGSPSAMPDVAASIEYARSMGVVVVAAAGNDGTGSSVSYPARHGQVIAVGAYRSGRSIASFSSRGPEVDVAAPGESIRSTLPGGQYGTKNGTSMAAPHVAGVAALMLDAGIAPGQVAARLGATAQNAGAPGFDTSFGWGIVNPRAAVR